MAKVHRLYLYLNTRYVGELIQSTAGAISFKYSTEWIESFPDYGISLSLPVQESEYRGEEVFSYFDNLLPDNDQIRRVVAEKTQAKSSRTFDLLSSVGRDCVGALRFLSEKIEISELDDIRGEDLSDEQISKVLSNLKSFPLGIQNKEFRLSIAGAQEKTALLRYKNKWMLPLDATPTTHIMKPPMGELQNGIDLKTSVENEWLCLKLCEFFGLEVANATIENFGEKKCLSVERFDRLWIEGKKLARIAQEDLCQVLKYPSGQKYESDGGPGIKEVMNFLDASLNREKDKADFLRAQIIFWLIGATDGHAKNYSVFLRTEGFFLTPFYDIMSMYPALETKQVNLREMKLSFKLGKSRNDRLDKIRKRHFYESASLCNFSSKELDRIFDELMIKTEDNFRERIRLPENFPKNVYDSIIKNTFKNIERLKSV
jgi:serine/threonine-protein kinase HipA